MYLVLHLQPTFLALWQVMLIHHKLLNDADKGKALHSQQVGSGPIPYQPQPLSMELVKEDMKKYLPTHPGKNVLSPSETPKSSFPALLPPLSNPNPHMWKSCGVGELWRWPQKLEGTSCREDKRNVAEPGDSDSGLSCLLRKGTLGASLLLWEGQ